MAGFKGKYEHSVDDKGRVSLPSKIRKFLSPEANDTFVITRGYEEYSLYLYPLDVWNRYEDTLRSQLNVHRAEDRMIVRTLMMWAHEVTLDRQSRLMIPQEHLEFSEITTSVVIIGALEKIELWSPDRFREFYYQQHPERSLESMAARVLGGV